MLPRNAYPGKCNQCGCQVKAQQGYRQKLNGSWVVWCTDHTPERKTPTERKLTADGRVLWPYDPNELDIVRAMPGAKFIGTDNVNWAPIGEYRGPYWTVSTTPGDIDRVLELAERLNLQIAPELLQFEKSEQAVEAETEGLYPFQVKGVDWLSKRTASVLGDDMGLGKTVQALRALRPNAAALVVAPKIVKSNWAEETKKWRPDLKPVVIEGKKNFRLPNAGEVVIVNYAILPKWLEAKKENPNDKYANSYKHIAEADRKQLSDIDLIVDEVHLVKNYKTQRAKRVKGLAMHAKTRVGLTGTPLENRPLDFWGVLSSMHLQFKVFRSWKHFVDCFNGGRNGWGGYEFGKPKEIVPELLRRVMLRRRRDEVLPDLPTKTYSWIKVDVGSRLARKLDGMWDEWRDTIEKGDLPSFESFSRIRRELAASRTDAALEYVEDAEEQDVPLVVFSAHVEPVEAIGEREGWAAITGETPSHRRTEIVRQFQAGELKGVAATIKAAGIGLTLTKAWKALFIDMDWTPAKNWQAEDRICRIGQEADKCEIVRMVSDHPLDIHVQELLSEKIKLIQAAIEDSIQGIDHPIEEEESEEEYEERMARLKEAVEEKELEEKEFWANTEPAPLDPEIPF